MASPFREDLLFRIANTYEHNKWMWI
jgi:hypothetical protein